jgi:ribosomal protein S8
MQQILDEQSKMLLRLSKTNKNLTTFLKYSKEKEIQIDQLLILKNEIYRIYQRIQKLKNKQ